MSLGQLWMTLRAAWLKIALMVVVAASVAFGLASGLPKQYTAKARVMLNIDNADPMQYSALGRGMAAPYIATEMRLITDLAVTTDVVTKLGWPENPQVIGAWQASGGAGDVTTWAARQLAQGIGAAPFRDSSIVEIFYSSSSLDAAKQIVALVRTAYIDHSGNLRVDAARRASAWNRTQAARALVVVHAAEAARTNFMAANQIAVDTPAGGLDYQNHVETMAATTARVPDAAFALGINANADALRRRLNTFDLEIAVLRLRGDANPATVALQAQRAVVAQQLAHEVAVTQGGPSASGAQIGLVRQQRDADYLRSRLTLLARAPLYDRLATLDRDITLKTERYMAAAARVANFDAIANAPNGMKVVGDVIASDEPSFPNIPLMTAIAAGSALALGIALTLLAELGRRQVRGAEDLRFFAQVPVLAVIPEGPRRRARKELPRFRWRWRGSLKTE